MPGGWGAVERGTERESGVDVQKIKGVVTRQEAGNMRPRISE